MKHPWLFIVAAGLAGLSLSVVAASAAAPPLSLVEISQSAALGDMDGDGVLTFDDINPFILALQAPVSYVGQYGLHPDIVGDIDGDGVLTFDDINPFITLLQTPPGPKPNIVLIMADDLGYNHLSSYGQQRLQTPNIDSLAQDGVRFTQAYSGCTVCGPSRAVLLTGKFLGRLPYRRNSASTPVPNDFLTLPELMKQAGYATGYFGKWGSGEQDTDMTPWRQGCDEFVGLTHQGHGHIHFPPYIWNLDQPLALNNDPRGNSGQDAWLTSLSLSGRRQHTDDVYTDRAVDFINRNQAKPFFCMLSFSIPHTEMAASNALYQQYRNHPLYSSAAEYSVNTYPHTSTNRPVAHFGGMLLQVDVMVGRVLAELDRLNLSDDTIVIFTSDNGGQLQSVWGNAPSNFFNANGVLRGGKQENYEGGIRVPMIIRWPGAAPANVVSDQICHFADLLPTLADLAGIRPPQDIDGLSLAPTLLGNSANQTQHNFLYWEHPVYNGAAINANRWRQAVRMGAWKALRETRTGGIELYNLNVDLSETNNIAAQNTGIVGQMRQIMDQQHGSPQPTQPNQTLPANGNTTYY